MERKRSIVGALGSVLRLTASAADVGAVLTGDEETAADLKEVGGLMREAGNEENLRGAIEHGAEVAKSKLLNSLFGT